MKKIIILIAIIAVIGLGYYFFSSRENSLSGQAPVAAPASAPAASEKSAPAAGNQGAANTPPPAAAASGTIVGIKNSSFNPPVLLVAAGTTITWVNNDTLAHTVAADNNLFSSPSLAPGESFSFVFANPGTVTYHCNIHPEMKGGVAVK